MTDDRTAQIRQQMREIRSDLRDDAATIVENAKLSVDWRHYLERYPWTCMAAALAVGYVIVPRRSPHWSMDRGDLEAMAQKLKSSLPTPAAATKEQSRGFLMGIALPLLGKVAMQGGLALLQSRFLGPNEERPQPPGSKRHPSHHH